MDQLSDLVPDLSNVLTADTLKVAGVIMSLLAAKWAVGKAWNVTKTVAKATAASMSFVGVTSAVLLTLGTGSIGLGVGEVSKVNSTKVEPVVYTAKPEDNPDLVKIKIDRQIQDFSDLDFEQYRARWNNLPPAQELARVTQTHYNPQDHVLGTTSIGLGVGMLVVGIATFLKKYG